MDEFEFGSFTVHSQAGFTAGDLIRDEMIQKGPSTGLYGRSGKFEKIRVVTFATKKGPEMLGKGKKWYVDGTFKSVPNIFTQIVTFHTKYLGGTGRASTVSALLSQKLPTTFCMST